MGRLDLRRFFSRGIVIAAGLLALRACGGSEFAGDRSDSPDASAGSGQGGSAGSSAGTGGAGGGGAGASSCAGPEDCDDSDPCTVDSCNADLECESAPKCAPGEVCCAGACGQCCGADDCDDMVACTDDTCFAGFCSHVPNDGVCADGEYCSVASGCLTREECIKDEDCDDSDPCTTDRCDGGLCQRAFCDVEGGELCCQGLGCGTCCQDFQCSDGDPCTSEACVLGSCSDPAPICDAGQLCCNDGTCGECCSAADCDDLVACTIDSCAGGNCSHVPDDTACGPTEICDPVQGCVTVAQCSSPADCDDGDPCKTWSCVGGSCQFLGCGVGSQCCADGCKQCCDAGDCDDGVFCTIDDCAGGTCTFTPDNGRCLGGFCDPVYGCVQCLPGDPGPCNDNDPCTEDLCVSLACSNPPVCAQGERCCPESGGASGGVTCQQCCHDNDCPDDPVACTIGKCVSGTCVLINGCLGGKVCCPMLGCRDDCASGGG